MGRTDRISRQDQAPSPRQWLSMDSAPKDGTRVELWIPYTKDTEAVCADFGHWDADAEHLGWGDKKTDPNWRALRVIGKGCWRFDGDDGSFDIQPTKWRLIGQQ